MFSKFRSRTESKKFSSARWWQRSDNGRSIARRIAPDSVSKRFSDTTTPVSPTTSGKPPTFVTTGKTDEEAYALLREFGLPFKNAKKN